VLAEPDFIEGNLSTKFMERFMAKKPGGGSRQSAQGAGE
jgi:hypothetical protein